MDRPRSLSPDSRLVIDGLLNLDIVQRSPRTSQVAESLLNLAEEALLPIDGNIDTNLEQEQADDFEEQIEANPPAQAQLPPEPKKVKRKRKSRNKKHYVKKRRNQTNYRKFPAKRRRADGDDVEVDEPMIFDMDPAEATEPIPNNEDDMDESEEEPPILPEKGNQIVIIHFYNTFYFSQFGRRKFRHFS